MKNLIVVVILGIVQKNGENYAKGEKFVTEDNDSILTLDPPVVEVIGEQEEDEILDSEILAVDKIDLLEEKNREIETLKNRLKLFENQDNLEPLPEVGNPAISKVAEGIPELKASEVTKVAEVKPSGKAVKTPEGLTSGKSVKTPEGLTSGKSVKS